ncbi:MAG TPA: DUF937 domain-containing protein [Gemmatimonadaceae bacterium]|nr:DUF937 domain-containing protein [Gemmatimonadaceae bacterium]
MNSIIDVLSRQLDGDTMTAIGRRLGTDEHTAANAVRLALPVLVGAIARHAADPRYAGALGQALDTDHDGSVIDHPAQLFAEPQLFSGAGILRHVFGARRAEVEQGIARVTGLDAAQVAQIMLMIAPLLMGALGRMKRQRGLDTRGLGGVLRDERLRLQQRSPAVAGLGAVLDPSRDGHVADDIVRMGSQVLGGTLGVQHR